MVPALSVASHGSPKLFFPGAFGMVPPSVKVWPPSVEFYTPLKLLAAVKTSSVRWESL